MSASRTLRPRALLLAILLVGCRNPFGSDGGPAERPASLHVHVHFGNVPGPFGPYSPDSAWMRAMFDAGVSRDGTPRAFGAHVRVAGRTVEPQRLSGVQYWYDLTLPAARSAVDVPIVIRAPDVQGVTPTTPELRLRGVAMAGPDTVRVADGAELRLPVVVPTTRVEPAPSRSYWSLALVPGDAGYHPHLVSLGGSGMPPAELRVPPSLLPAPLDGRLTAMLTTVDELTFPYDRHPEYGVGYMVQSVLRWVVYVTPPPASP